VKILVFSRSLLAANEHEKPKFETEVTALMQEAENIEEKDAFLDKHLK
jgi:hypothetical protein